LTTTLVDRGDILLRHTLIDPAKSGLLRRIRGRLSRALAAGPGSGRRGGRARSLAGTWPHRGGALGGATAVRGLAKLNPDDRRQRILHGRQYLVLHRPSGIRGAFRLLRGRFRR